MIKTSRVIGIVGLGLFLALVLPELNVNSTLSIFIAFAVMLVVVLVLAARQEGQRTKGVRERDEARASGKDPH
jgi:membrane protein implicated in regulation of membrane protease activity